MVLIVDDDEGIRETLMVLLSIQGFECVWASQGQEAMELLHQGIRPRVILLDWMMPIMNGEEFLKRKNEDPLLRSIPVIVMTAFSTSSPFDGTMDVLRKPFDLEDLIQRIVKAGADPLKVRGEVTNC